MKCGEELHALASAGGEHAGRAEPGRREQAPFAANATLVGSIRSRSQAQSEVPLSSSHAEQDGGSAPAAVKTPLQLTANRKWLWAASAAGLVLSLLVGSTYFMIKEREKLEQARLELERRTRMQVEEKERAAAAAEEARQRAEQETARLARQKQEAEARQRELEAQQRNAELKREAETKRQTAEARLRQAEAKRTATEAKERQLRSQQTVAAAATPAAQPRAGIQGGVQQACAHHGAFKRGFCEGAQCMKPSNANDPVCVRLREAAERNNR
jgi:hypothetical protein